MVMLVGSVLLHVVALGLFWGIRLVSGNAPRKAHLVSREILIDVGPPLKPVAPPVRLPQLRPLSEPAMSKFEPPAGKPINVLATTAPTAMAGVPSGGEDLKSRMLGLGGVGKGLVGGGTGARSFSLGGGTVRANAIIVLLDASGSMQENRKLERAREKIRELAKGVGIRVMAEIEVPNCEFHRIAEPGADPQSPLDAAYAMSAAMRRFAFADAIYFFSDFQDTVSPEAVDHLRLIATECEPKVRVYLHTLEQTPDVSLVALCRATGGQILK
ncbi:MAG TPA: hypothetical protein PLU30_25770 [Verrucomicrobiae bacterium]|nr:hypothetical protein [Verrucomicrobiae bacterium]